ncbi:hypothetical protein [Bradyrhizobium acaciae]|uniref:hypothetical protein n=1 Tax=Bradyrhizobium acaciae TaxID=2683706 RepID=UPI001E58B842|nr:hypothetical protein [Bradyrhizobium acaciae]MCC8981621.1 hypothetical protein [Bradyrhizobium acaciae]
MPPRARNGLDLVLEGLQRCADRLVHVEIFVGAGAAGANLLPAEPVTAGVWMPEAGGLIAPPFPWPRRGGCATLNPSPPIGPA